MCEWTSSTLPQALYVRRSGQLGTAQPPAAQVKWRHFVVEVPGHKTTAQTQWREWVSESKDACIIISHSARQNAMYEQVFGSLSFLLSWPGLIGVNPGDAWPHLLHQKTHCGCNYQQQLKWSASLLRLPVGTNKTAAWAVCAPFPTRKRVVRLSAN